MIFVLVGVGSRTGSRRRLSCDRTPPPTPWAIDVLGSGSEVVGDGACIIFLECARTVRIHADGRDDLEINSVVGPPGMVVTAGIVVTHSNVPLSHTLYNALMRVDNMLAVHWCRPRRRRQETPSEALMRSSDACSFVVDSDHQCYQAQQGSGILRIRDRHLGRRVPGLAWAAVPSRA